MRTYAWTHIYNYQNIIEEYLSNIDPRYQREYWMAVAIYMELGQAMSRIEFQDAIEGSLGR